MERYIKKTLIPVPPEEVFHWLSQPSTFHRLCPPWQKVRCLNRRGGVKDGDTITLKLSMGPFDQIWALEHFGYQENFQFCDRQIKGPFSFYQHFHRVHPVEPEMSGLEDLVEFELPYGLLGKLFLRASLKSQLQRIFRYRHEVTLKDLIFKHSYQGARLMKIALAGSSGFIGSELVPFLKSQGHSIIHLIRVRSARSKEKIFWDPDNGVLDPDELEGVDAIINLSGENISDEKWTAEKKVKILESRLKSTSLIAHTINKMKTPPQVWIQASAIGYYGDTGDRIADEGSPPGSGFLAEVCREWEEATQTVRSETRVVLTRFGMVLSPKGGALKTMLTPFNLGIAGVIGSGKQWVSWITIDDLCRILLHCIYTPSLQGPVNVVSPESLTNHNFTKTLGTVLKKPTVISMPAFAAKIAFGEMAEEILLRSPRVYPRKLVETAYAFAYPHLEPALRHLLGK